MYLFHTPLRIWGRNDSLSPIAYCFWILEALFWELLNTGFYKVNSIVCRNLKSAILVYIVECFSPRVAWVPGNRLWLSVFLHCTEWLSGAFEMSSSVSSWIWDWDIILRSIATVLWVLIIAMVLGTWEGPENIAENFLSKSILTFLLSKNIYAVPGTVLDPGDQQWIRQAMSLFSGSFAT